LSRYPFSHRVFLFFAAVLSGCASFQAPSSVSTSSTSPSSTLATPAVVQGSAIAGNVHGGQQPVAAARIYLLAGNPAGYGAPSVSLLNPSQPGVLTDSIGTYVTTNSQGNFSIGGDYVCTEGQQVYLLARGGNPGLPAGEENPALALISAFGGCPEGQNNFATTVPFVSSTKLRRKQSEQQARSLRQKRRSHLACRGLYRWRPEEPGTDRYRRKQSRMDRQSRRQLTFGVHQLRKRDLPDFGFPGARSQQSAWAGCRLVG